MLRVSRVECLCESRTRPQGKQLLAHFGTVAKCRYLRTVSSVVCIVSHVTKYRLYINNFKKILVKKWLKKSLINAFFLMDSNFPPFRDSQQPNFTSFQGSQQPNFTPFWGQQIGIKETGERGGKGPRNYVKRGKYIIHHLLFVYL